MALCVSTLLRRPQCSRAQFQVWATVSSAHLHLLDKQRQILLAVLKESKETSDGSHAKLRKSMLFSSEYIHHNLLLFATTNHAQTALSKSVRKHETSEFLPVWWLSNRSNIFLTFLIAASLQSSRMSEPEYPSVLWSKDQGKVCSHKHGSQCRAQKPFLNYCIRTERFCGFQNFVIPK